MFNTGWALALGIALQSAMPPPTQPADSVPAVAQVTAPELWPDDHPFTRLFHNLLGDLKSVPSRNSAAILATGGASAAATRGADLRFANWIARSGESTYTSAGNVFGKGWVQSGGAVAAYAIGKLAGRPQLAHLGSDLIRAQTLNAVITTAIKVSVDRTRPSGGNHAFPSGHTSATFASAATLHAHYGWKAGIPAFTAAGFVAWSRTRDGAHWLSDVAFGSAVGIVSGRAVASRHRSRRLIVIPAPTRGGVAVTFLIGDPVAGPSTQTRRGSSPAPR